MPITFPGESTTYRDARKALLDKEIELRALVKDVAELRQSLPRGGQIPNDYTFVDSNEQPVPLSELFSKSCDTLAIYSLMYRPDADQPCPMCVSFLDGLDAQATHIGQRLNLVVVSAATPQQLETLARDRGWRNLRLLSAQGTTYQSDYHGETPDGAQLPMMNIFQNSEGGIFHFWGSEVLFSNSPGEPRHLDQLWPLWNMLDLTPHGRGKDWHPSLTY